MIPNRNYRFNTDRLLVDEWNSFSADEWPNQNLVRVIQEILTERTTQSLPQSWQGSYNFARAQQWIVERNEEGITLLAIDKSDMNAMALVILFEAEKSGYLRLGYILAESAWGKGYATELVGGFVDWCRENDIHSITGGVERDNIASRRVLEKCGFVAEAGAGETEEQLFTLDLS